MNEYAVTVLGHDRPGIIADVTEILARLGLNLTDSTMTRLRGHFAMTLICAGAPAAAEVEAALDPLADGGSLVIAVRRVSRETESASPGNHHVLVVRGADRLGIVATVTRTVAAAGGNITDLTTRLSGSLYLLIAEVDLPSGVDPGALGEQVHVAAARLGVDATLRPAEADLL